MNTTVKPLEKSQVELKVTIPYEKVEPFLDRAAEEFSKELHFKGFRPGKAPRKLVESRIGTQALLEEAVNIGMPKFYTDAITKENIEAIGMPKVSVNKLAPDNDIEFTATVSIMPEITLPDYRKITVAKEEKEVGDSDVQKTLDYLQKSRATYNHVEREAQKNDRVTVDFQMKQGNVELEDGNYTDHPVTIGEGQIVKGFEDQLIGLKKDATKTFSITFPNDHFKKEIAGKPVDFTVIMKKVEEVKLPELNDEFAKSLGQFTTLDELKTKLKENIKKEQGDKERERIEKEILEKISEQTKVSMPEVIIESELENAVGEIKQQVESMGGKFADYLVSVKKSEDDLRNDLRPAAKKRAKAGLIIREIAKKEDINATTEEITAEVNKYLLQYQGNPEVKKQVTSLEFKEHIDRVLRNRKVLDMLIESATKASKK
jgi:trigger factor